MTLRILVLVFLVCLILLGGCQLFTGPQSSEPEIDQDNVNSGTITISRPPTYEVGVGSISTLSIGVSATFLSGYLGQAVGYQWYLNGTPIVGATTSTLTYTPTVSTALYGINNLMLVIRDANGLSYSGNDRFTVID